MYLYIIYKERKTGKACLHCAKIYLKWSSPVEHSHLNLLLEYWRPRFNFPGTLSYTCLLSTEVLVINVKAYTIMPGVGLMVRGGGLWILGS